MKIRIRFAVVAVIVLACAIPALSQHYNRVDLTVDQASVSMTAPNHDGNLVNAWGLSRSSTSPWWISDNGTGLSTLYDGAGAPQKLVVTVPPPKGSTNPSTPTGTVYNPTGAFQVGLPGTNQPAIFLFATEDGTISGWNPNANLTVAVLKIDRSKRAIYKGLAIAQTSNGPLLYASNFKSGRVEVYDGGFARVPVGEDAFRDPFLRHLDDWAPFGIQNVGGSIIVTFAHRQVGSTDEDHGAGLGRVAIFDTRGHFLGELQHGPWMNAPWGIAMSPGDFGAFSHRILMGNFGDGTIHVFNALSGKHEGQLLDPSGNPIVIDGLWALSFGNGKNGLLNELYFTAGPNEEANGLLGKITVTGTEQRGNTE